VEWSGGLSPFRGGLAPARDEVVLCCVDLLKGSRSNEKCGNCQGFVVDLG
jgi:hypothetical protein